MTGRYGKRPMRYTLSAAEFITMMVCFAILIAALSFPLAWMLFRIAA